MVTYKIELSAGAGEQLRRIQDRRVRLALSEKINALARDPEKQGKALSQDLLGYRSVRAVGRRYRIIYCVDRGRVVVVVVAAGIRRDGDRRDIYELAGRLIRLGLAG